MSIFDKTGLSCIFANQLKLVLKERLQWFTDVENLSRGAFYSIFKFEFGFEKYLSKLSEKNRINLSRFRCSNIKSP
jgi:hypothetical protein